MMAVRLTREGGRFIVLLAVIAFAAYNTRNNLLYLMLSVGLAIAVVGLVAGYLVTARLTILRTDRPEAYAGQPFEETVTLGNTSRWLDAFGVELTGASRPVPLVPRWGEARANRTRLYRRRGVYHSEPTEIAGQFPYGVFRYRRGIDTKGNLVVYPRVRPVDTSWLVRDRFDGDSLALRRGAGEEFYRLRSYLPGDHVHLVHWRSSAKQGELMVRELGDDGDPLYCLTFVPSLSEGSDGSEFEVLVSAVASLASHFTREGVGFRYLSTTIDLPPRRSDEHLRSVLTHLATVTPAEELHHWRDEVRASLGRGETVVVVYVNDSESFGLGASSQLHLVSPRELFV